MHTLWDKLYFHIEPVDWEKIEQEKEKARKERKKQYDKERRARLKAEAALREAI